MTLLKHETVMPVMKQALKNPLMNFRVNQFFSFSVLPFFSITCSEPLPLQGKQGKLSESI